MQERTSVASKSTVSSEDRLLLDISRKREEKAKQKLKAQKYFEKLKAHSVYESKDIFLQKEISLKLQSVESTATSDIYKTKLFGLTQAKAPLIHRPVKPKALTSEEIELLAIQKHGKFKARPFNKLLFQERNSVPPIVTPKKSDLSFAI